MQMLLHWFEFLLCSAIIVYCGIGLSRNGDVIAEKTGLGRAWMGLILLASVTSLPELMIGISSVALANVPNIALGDIMGSCVFNLTIIAMMDVIYGPGPIFSRVQPGHVLSAGFGTVLISVAVLSILAGGILPAIGHVGLTSFIIVVIYVAGIRSVFLFEKKKIAEFVGGISEKARYDHITLRTAVKRYAVNAFLIIAAATWLPFIGEHLAEETGMGKSFFGSIFIALTTSLPEIVVSFSALRIGAADMAIANLLGSNMFNILILAADDLFYTKGPLLSAVAASHAITGVTAVLMTGIVSVGLIYRASKKSVLRVGWDAFAIILVYFVMIAMLYAVR